MATPRTRIANNREIWYWHERDNELATRTDPFKKSHAVKQCFTRYFEGVSSMRQKFNNKPRFQNKNTNYRKNTVKESGNAVGMFKRTAEAAGTVVSWGMGITNDSARDRTWSLDSVLELSLDEFKTKLQNLDKHPEFHGLINKKAVKNKNINIFKIFTFF